MKREGNTRAYKVFEEGKETRKFEEANVFEEGKETRELIKYLKKGRKHARL